MRQQNCPHCGAVIFHLGVLQTSPVLAVGVLPDDPKPEQDAAGNWFVICANPKCKKRVELDEIPDSSLPSGKAWAISARRTEK